MEASRFILYKHSISLRELPQQTGDGVQMYVEVVCEEQRRRAKIYPIGKKNK